MAEQKDAANNKRIKRPTAKKRDIQNEKRRLRNKSFKARVSTAVTSFKSSVAAKDTSAMNEQLNMVYSLMDKGVKTGVFKVNKAARVKSRLHHMTVKG
ncbi:MAG TPA: 30S ribosomal protein S20 [Rhabdochlamydiaceae bacterium]|nr:30S ribosomal protein S20 [Rhabdochlamydiaceae bacterium]